MFGGKGSRERAAELQVSWRSLVSAGMSGEQQWEQHGQSPWPHQAPPFQVTPNTLQQMAFLEDFRVQLDSPLPCKHFECGTLKWPCCSHLPLRRDPSHLSKLCPHNQDKNQALIVLGTSLSLGQGHSAVLVFAPSGRW